MSELKDKIKEIRKREGLSQDEMGRKVGYTNRASVNKIENGNGDARKKQFRPDTLDNGKAEHGPK